MVINGDQVKILRMSTSKPEITKRQQQLLNELKRCTDELSGQELHRQLHNGERGTLAPACGFDTYCLWNYPGTGSSRYWKPSIVQNGKLLETKSTDYGPDIFSNFLIDFIQRNKDKPFFAYYPMVLVHSPFPKTPDNKPKNGKTAQGKGQALPNFRDMTLYADKIVGRIILALERYNICLLYTSPSPRDS